MKEKPMATQTITTIYRFLTSIRLSFFLLLLLTADLCMGYICLHGNASFYEPMNTVGLIQWLTTYGFARPMLSAWFFILLVLLFCLVINTLVCTCDKLYHLGSTLHARLTGRRVWLTITAHLMHLAIVLLFAGYLISYTMSDIENSVTVMPGGKAVSFGSGLSFTLTKMDLTPYKHNRLDGFIGRYIDSDAHLIFNDGDNDTQQAVLSLNNPVSYWGYSFFLQRFNPRSAGEISPSKYIVIDIRRDPGTILTFTGMGAFILGLIGFIMLKTPFKTSRRKAI